MQEALRPSLSQHVSMTALPLSQLAKPDAGRTALKHGARRADSRGAASSQRVPHVALPSNVRQGSFIHGLDL